MIRSYCDIVQNLPLNSVDRIYHDTQYGFPSSCDNQLFGKLILEINQAGFYLNYQLMGILRSYHSNISVGAELKDSLRDMELLYIKGHYVQCQKLLEKAKKKATKYEKIKESKTEISGLA